MFNINLLLAPAIKSAPMQINKTDETKQMKNLDLGGGCKINTTDIELNETFKCTGQELYNALTQKEMLQIFTGGEVKVCYSSSGNCNGKVWFPPILHMNAHYATLPMNLLF